MKILLVNTYYYPNMVGGTEQSIKLLAEELVKYGHEVSVITADSNKDEIEIINLVKVIRLNLDKKNESSIEKVIRKSYEFNNLSIKNKIIKILDEISPDIVHTNNLFYISPIIWKIASSKKIKIVHTIRDYWGLCPKSTLLDKNMNICTKKKLPCIIHSKNYKEFTKYVDIVTAPSAFTLELYKKNGYFKNSKKVMIPNAIDISFEEFENIISDREKRDSERIEFLFVGSLDQHKGIKFLIESFKEISNENYRLNICGKGSMEKYVREQCEVDGRISYIGSVFKEEKDKIFKKSDVIIVPSIWYEPFGRVVIEGYKYGLPVIACNIGGLEELLSRDISIGIEINNINQLKNAISDLGSRSSLKKYYKNIWKHLDEYKLNKQIDRFIKNYKSLIGVDL